MAEEKPQALMRTLWQFSVHCRKCEYQNDSRDRPHLKKIGTRRTRLRGLRIAAYSAPAASAPS
jgi:hypothetical protein